nr:hypothetical protein K-LCC10_0131 [Kaumoebavirus]
MSIELFEKLVRGIVLPFLPKFHVDDRVMIGKPKDLLTTVYICSPFGTQTLFSLHTNIYREFYIKVEGPGKLGPKYTSPLISNDHEKKLGEYLRNSLAFLDFEKDLAEKNAILDKVREMRGQSKITDTLEFLDSLC